MTRASLFGFLTLTFLAFSACQAQPPATPAPATPAAPATAAPVNPARAKDEAAIRAAVQGFAAAFQAGDAKALTALFTDEAEYLDEGNPPIHGREALAKSYGEFFAKRKELKAAAKTESIRFLGPDTAIEEGTFTVTVKDTPPSESRYSALYVRQADKWYIALLKEWEDDTTNKATLEDLAWLIGTWESTGPEITAKTTYSWTANKSFIRAEFSITPKKAGEKATAGVQVIGVDPAVGRIRSWLFGSDGGIGEATWGWDGELWMIDSAGTLADGSSTSAINFLARSGTDGFTWRSVSRTQAGETLPDLPVVTVKRTAAGSAEAPVKLFQGAK
jgi:uncharacterized protein (TIGR02246 family)